MYIVPSHWHCIVGAKTVLTSALFLWSVLKYVKAYVKCAFVYGSHILKEDHVLTNVVIPWKGLWVSGSGISPKTKNNYWLSVNCSISLVWNGVEVFNTLYYPYTFITVGSSLWITIYRFRAFLILSLPLQNFHVVFPTKKIVSFVFNLLL